LFWKSHFSPCHPVMIQWSECSIAYSLFWKSHCFPCHPVMIQWSECFIVFSLFWKSRCSPCHPVMIQWSECSIAYSLFWKSHCSPCLPVVIQGSECSIAYSFLFIVFSRVSPVLTRYVLAMKSSTLLQCQPMKLSYNIRLYIIQYCTRSRDWKRGWRK
jgi:hypothetical protein